MRCGRCDARHADDEALQIKNRYRTIAFDLGNTLIRFDHNISARKISHLFGVDSKKTYDMFFDSHLTRAFEKGLLSPREFYEKASAILGGRLPYKDFVGIWNDIFWEDTGTCELARELKKNYKLFLLSNVNRLHFEYIEERFDIIKIFDELILSFVVGAMKPERPIFEEVIRRSGGDRAGILYIDDREDLIKEAAAMGIDSIRFEGAEKLREQLRFQKVI